MTPAEEVKSRLDIVEVIQEYISLKPAGANWRARCPFHDEKTPSFMVSKPKQMWHCFGCGEGGDVFSFVMRQEGMEFPEALRLLAVKAGVALRSEPPAVRSERDRLLGVMDLAAKFWASVLWNTNEAAAARQYLQEERHILPDTIREWEIGFAPESWDSLIIALGKRGIPEDDVIRVGAAVKKMQTRGRGAYDRFRNRIMFPICDAHGRTIGAAGRAMPGSDSEAKYVNTPETMLYHKGSVLFGLDKAKQDIRKENVAVIVEGNLDVIASHQAGVKNVVAASGTALTEEQCLLLKRFTDRLVFCFDADAAGEAATLRALMVAFAQGFTVELIELPKRADGSRYKDPDECIRSGVELWRQAIGAAEPVIDRYLRRAREEKDLRKLEEKQSLTKLLLPVIAKLPDAVAKAHYLRALAEVVGVPEGHLREALSGSPSEASPTRPQAAAVQPKQRDQRYAAGEQFLAALVRQPSQMPYAAMTVTPDMLPASLAPLYAEMVVHYTETHDNQRVAWSDEAFRERLQQLPHHEERIHLFDILSLLADKEFAELTPALLERELVSAAKRLRIFYLRDTLKSLEQSIREAERSGGDPARLAPLIEEFQTKSAELVHLDQSN